MNVLIQCAAVVPLHILRYYIDTYGCYVCVYLRICTYDVNDRTIFCPTIDISTWLPIITYIYIPIVYDLLLLHRIGIYKRRCPFIIHYFCVLLFCFMFGFSFSVLSAGRMLVYWYVSMVDDGIYGECPKRRRRKRKWMNEWKKERWMLKVVHRQVIHLSSFLDIFHTVVHILIHTIFSAARAHFTVFCPSSSRCLARSMWILANVDCLRAQENAHTCCCVSRVVVCLTHVNSEIFIRKT